MDEQRFLQLETQIFKLSQEKLALEADVKKLRQALILFLQMPLPMEPLAQVVYGQEIEHIKQQVKTLLEE